MNNYSDELKPAKILTQPPLDYLTQRIFLESKKDTEYYSDKKPEYNENRYVYNLETDDFNLKPSIRFVSSEKSSKHYNFLCNYYDINGVSLVSMQIEDKKRFSCSIKIMPLNKLSQLADKEFNSDFLKIDTNKAKVIIELNITIEVNNSGEAVYKTNSVETFGLKEFLTENEKLKLKKDLEFQGAKIAAHFCQEILQIIPDPDVPSRHIIPKQEYILLHSENRFKELLLGSTMIGNVALEIVGSHAIKDIDDGWKNTSEFLAYML